MTLNMKTYRIVFLGSEGVGKTSLILQFMHGCFNKHYKPTLEDCYRHVVRLPNGIFQQIEIVDTSGDDQFPVMRDLNIRTGDAFVVVYSVDNMGTFYEAQNFCNLISSIKGEKKVPVVMVGNKTDLTDSWEVPTDVAFRAAAIDLNCSYIETSAKCNINVDNAFQVLLPNYKDPSAYESDSESQKGGFKKRFRRNNSLNLLKMNSAVKKYNSVDYGTAQCNAQCTIL